MAHRQQFNVNLDPALVRRVKYHAIDMQLSLSELVGRVLTAHLDTTTAQQENAGPFSIPWTLGLTA